MSVKLLVCGQPVGPEESEDVPALTQNDEQVWDRLKEGTYCIIWLKTEEKSILRVLEVLEVVDGQSSWPAGIIFTGPRALSIPNSHWRSSVLCQCGLICALSRARVPNGGRKTNMGRFSVSVHSGNSCWLQQVSICSLMEKFRLRSVPVPTRGFDEWYPRRRAPSLVFQNRLRLSLKSKQHFEARLGREL